MAVQTHYRSSNTFSSGAGVGMRSDNIWEEFQPLGHRNLAPMMNVNVTVFSEPESELTCNASGSRKRARDNQLVAADVSMKTQQPCHHHYHHQQQQSKVQAVLNNLNFHEPGNDSSPASTSGRTEQLGSYRDLELEALIRFQNQKLRLMVEETRKKQSMSLLSMIEQTTLKKLVEKETELERANRANMELEEKVKKMIGENQMWFNAAKNSEATVSSLRLSLEQILLRNAGNQVAAEGFGETDGVDEAQFRYDLSKTELKNPKSCKVCGRYDASFLVLPCRHLCLCGDCELRVHCCPVCDAVKNSALQVFVS